MSEHTACFESLSMWKRDTRLEQMRARKGFVKCTDLISVSKVKVKLSLCLTKHRTMKTYWGVEV
jgi:hypothetical protein